MNDTEGELMHVKTQVKAGSETDGEIEIEPEK